ncbi:hypothetical protein BCV72DRAFT_313635 [Rhizopus microsporus var. microsporus]|uniref:Uncharacterized protein n=1 Tax=Rhizopus microsporus var. microsporus TaxID=86635 RepID=A0A1X0REF0_RHIZD|nr:hypothetical protein BCV72DRAFT_313635 [Rhizopus microsporus var. microsporus]
MFSNFEGFRKRPIVTYSRKARVLKPETPKADLPSPPYDSSPPVVQSSLSSSSSSCSDLAVEEKENDIFDFPEEEAEIELMVASTRHTPSSPKPTTICRPRKKPKQQNKKTTKTKAVGKNLVPLKSTIHPISHPITHTVSYPVTEPATDPISYPVSYPAIGPATVSGQQQSYNHSNSIDSYDVFAFDPAPYQPRNKYILPQQQQQQVLPSNTLYSSIITTNIFNAPSHIPIFNTHFNHMQPLSYLQPMQQQPLQQQPLEQQPLQQQSLQQQPLQQQSLQQQSLQQQPLQQQSLQQQSLQQQPIQQQSKKKNLVAHLKTANGEKENIPIVREYDFSDEEDIVPQLPLKQPIVQVDRSASPELSYEERMEKELESIMKSEFGESKEQETTEINHRPRYQPLNEIKVKVTYTKRVKQ